MVLLTIVVLLMLAHTSFVFTAFLLHYYDAAIAARPTPSLGSYVRAALREWWFELISTLSYPLGWLPDAAPLRFDPTAGPPIVLVHGYIRNRGCMLVLAWRLKRAGLRNVYNVGLGNTLAPIERLSQRLSTRLATVFAVTGGVPLVGIGHSLGGIALRWCVDHGASLGRIITLGTPHRGTRVAYVGPGESAVQLRPGSSFLSQLDDPPHVPLDALYSTHDNIVIPFESAAYGENPRQFEELGHITLLYDTEVFERVLELLDARSR